MELDYSYIKLADLTDEQFTYFNKAKPKKAKIRELIGADSKYKFGVGDTLAAMPKGSKKGELYKLVWKGRAAYKVVIEPVGEEDEMTLCWTYSVYPL